VSVGIFLGDDFGGAALMRIHWRGMQKDQMPMARMPRAPKYRGLREQCLIEREQFMTEKSPAFQ